MSSKFILSWNNNTVSDLHQIFSCSEPRILYFLSIHRSSLNSFIMRSLDLGLNSAARLIVALKAAAIATRHPKHTQKVNVNKIDQKVLPTSHTVHMPRPSPPLVCQFTHPSVHSSLLFSLFTKNDVVPDAAKDQKASQLLLRLG